MNLLEELRLKIRSLCEDFSKIGIESFTYESGDQIFILQEDYPNNITSVTKNGIALGSGDYSFDSSTNEITISISLSSGDIIITKYTYYKYSTSELDEYIRSALVWISAYSHCEDDYELESDDIYPSPDNQTEDMIALIASIIVKPDYTEYRLPNLTVRYANQMSKEDKIQRLIERFEIGLGVSDILTFNG